MEERCAPATGTGGELLRLGLEHVQKALQGGELPGGGGVELGREDRGGGVAGQEGEELVVHGGEGGLLEEQLVDRDHPDHAVLDLQGDDRERLFEGGRVAPGDRRRE